MTAATKTRLRITRRGRAVLTTLVAVPVVAAALIITVNGGGALAAAENAAELHSPAAPFTYVTVQAGESMWQLAETLAPAADPRDVIAQMVSLNQLDSASVWAGQRLAVPTEYSK